ncbi:hypothetical protein M422DRAFT_248559 [Sphaerobolus stellatus SS14]|nr:hypothetical protein M422DRAFT_248559 [Sphaerobolus stellatus SS14]
MGEVPAGDPRRTIRGFKPDKKFDGPVPKLVYNDPYEDEKDRQNKVSRYWRAHDQERLQRESRYHELLGIEETAASRKRMEEAAKALKKSQEDETAWAKEKGKEKEKEGGPFGNAKGKAREVPSTPKKLRPKNPNMETGWRPRMMVMKRKKGCSAFSA